METKCLPYLPAPSAEEKKSQAAYYAQVAGAIAAQKKNVCNRVAVCIIVKQPCEDLRVFIAVHCILDDVGGVLKT